MSVSKKILRCWFQHQRSFLPKPYPTFLQLLTLLLICSLCSLSLPLALPPDTFYLSPFRLNTWLIWCLIIFDCNKLIEVTTLFHLWIAYNKVYCTCWGCRFWKCNGGVEGRDVRLVTHQLHFDVCPVLLARDFVTSVVTVVASVAHRHSADALRIARRRFARKLTKPVLKSFQKLPPTFKNNVCSKTLLWTDLDFANGQMHVRLEVSGTTLSTMNNVLLCFWTVKTKNLLS